MAGREFFTPLIVGCLMQMPMTFGAKRNQVPLIIGAAPPSGGEVVNLQIGSAAAGLAAPAVALQDLPPQLVILAIVQPISGAITFKLSHMRRCFAMRLG
jgi:hypothetical protein